MPRTVVVTGASSGIGAALSSLLSKRGDQVLGVDLASSDIVADLSTPHGRIAAAEEVGKCTEHVDAVITCAGTSNPGEAMVTVNYFGSTEFVEALQPLLVKAEAPRVVLVGSISGTQPNDPAVVDACLRGDEQAALTAARAAIADNRAFQLYPSSKSAIAQWARRTSVSEGWADEGIAVNVVAPGVVLTPMTDELFADPKMKALMDKAVPMPLHGYAAAEDVARVLAYFADAATTHITGQVVYVDGGAEATLRPAAHY